jgi:DNA-binding NtrC family response regulator
VPECSVTNVVVVSGSDETRMLLRGLLRLQRHRVVAEGAKVESLEKIPLDGSDTVLVLDVDVGDADWAKGLREAMTRRPNLRVVLLTPTRGGRIEEQAIGLGIHTLLRRPFAVHELVEAVAGAAPVGPPTTPPESPP